MFSSLHVTYTMLTVTYFWYKYKSHGKEATQKDGDCHEGEAGVLMGANDEGDGGRDDTQHNHIVYTHTHKPGVVHLLDLHTARLIGQQQAKQK